MSAITQIRKETENPFFDNLSLRATLAAIQEARSALIEARANMFETLDRAANFQGDWAEIRTFASMAFVIAFEGEAKTLRNSAREEGAVTGNVLMGELLDEEVGELLLMGAIALDGPRKALELVGPSVEG